MFEKSLVEHAKFASELERWRKWNVVSEQFIVPTPYKLQLGLKRWRVIWNLRYSIKRRPRINAAIFLDIAAFITKDNIQSIPNAEIYFSRLYVALQFKVAILHCIDLLLHWSLPVNKTVHSSIFICNHISWRDITFILGCLGLIALVKLTSKWHNKFTFVVTRFAIDTSLELTPPSN